MYEDAGIANLRAIFWSKDLNFPTIEILTGILEKSLPKFDLLNSSGHGGRKEGVEGQRNIWMVPSGWVEAKGRWLGLV